MRETPHPGHSHTESSRNSESPTQILWDSSNKTRNLAEVSQRRAARRRERLEALLKGDDTAVTQTEVDLHPPGEVTSATQLSIPPPSRSSLPAAAYPAPPSPIAGPRLALYVALGVAVGGVLALQIDRLLNAPSHSATPTTAYVAMDAPSPDEASYAYRYDSTEEVPATNDDANGADVTPNVERLVPPPAVRRQRMALAAAPATPPMAAAPTETPLPPNVSPSPPSLVLAQVSEQTACSQYPTVHIPTQLHPRVNPLMSSSQVFADHRLRLPHAPPPNQRQ
jgi:hypothetical protein